MVKRMYNFRFFENLDQELQAYWFMFIRCDGFISPSKRTVGVTLGRKDKSHLVKLAQATDLDPNYIKDYEQIAYGKLAKFSRILFSTKVFYNDVIAHGFDRAKKDLVIYPEVPRSVLHHGLRAMFDADGTIGFRIQDDRSKLRMQYWFGISVPTFEAAKQVRQWFYDLGVKQPMSIIADKTIWSVRTANSKALLTIHDILYSEATVWLDRKKRTFDMVRDIVTGKVDLINKVS